MLNSEDSGRSSVRFQNWNRVTEKEWRKEGQMSTEENANEERSFANLPAVSQWDVTMSLLKMLNYELLMSWWCWRIVLHEFSLLNKIKLAFKVFEQLLRRVLTVWKFIFRSWLKLTLVFGSVAIFVFTTNCKTVAINSPVHECKQYK